MKLKAKESKEMIDPTVKMVLEFHKTFDCYYQQSPNLPPATEDGDEALKEASELLMKARAILREKSKSDNRCSRISLIAEETAELANAYVEKDLVKVLDAYLDIGYVGAGGVINCGMQDIYYEGMCRVHNSNMSKLGEDGKAIYDSAGKVIKGPNYKPVDLSDLVK